MVAFACLAIEAFKSVKAVAPAAYQVWSARNNAPRELEHAICALERAMGVLQRGMACAMTTRTLTPLTQRIEDMANKIKEITNAKDDLERREASIRGAMLVAGQFTEALEKLQAKLDREIDLVQGDPEYKVLVVGSTVKVTSTQRMGDIIETDRTFLPYKVRFADERMPAEDWIAESNVVLLKDPAMESPVSSARPQVTGQQLSPTPVSGQAQQPTSMRQRQDQQLPSAPVEIHEPPAHAKMPQTLDPHCFFVGNPRNDAEWLHLQTLGHRTFNYIQEAIAALKDLRAPVKLVVLADTYILEEVLLDVPGLDMVCQPGTVFKLSSNSPDRSVLRITQPCTIRNVVIDYTHGWRSAIDLALLDEPSHAVLINLKIVLTRIFGKEKQPFPRAFNVQPSWNSCHGGRLPCWSDVSLQCCDRPESPPVLIADGLALLRVVALIGWGLTRAGARLATHKSHQQEQEGCSSDAWCGAVSPRGVDDHDK